MLGIRDFKEAKIHLENLKQLMEKSDLVNLNYIGKYIAILSFLKIFENKILEAIFLIQDSVDKFGVKIPEREMYKSLKPTNPKGLVNRNSLKYVDKPMKIYGDYGGR